MKHLLLLILTSCLCIIPVPANSAENEPTYPKGAMEWEPKDYPEATLYARIEYLEPAREWERMDIWVPRKPAEGKMPCVIAVYGGGYGEKSRGFINDVRPLLERGFVVAAPDYALQTDAPVPLCSWDVAQAIRWLRNHADEYRIDPERIGLWGWSAGGWIGQDLCYTGPERFVHTPTKGTGEKVSRWFPMLQPEPPHADTSIRVQAVVTDWGAGKLWDRRSLEPKAWLSADDPPLFTCYNEKFEKGIVNPVTLLQRLGVPSGAIYGVEGSTHVPKLASPAHYPDGGQTNWGESIYDFFEDRLVMVDTATSPEMIPHGGAISGPTAVRLLTVHAGGAIHYTLDGGEPSARSARYNGPVSVKPGQTLKAIAIKEGLEPSRIASGDFVSGPPKPKILDPKRTVQLRLGESLKLQFEAENSQGAQWFVGGKAGITFRQFQGQRFNPPKHIPWMEMDPESGLLTGTPNAEGVYPVIISCMTPPDMKGDKLPEAGDAVLLVVYVSAGTK